MDEGRGAVPGLNLLPDDRLDSSVVFTPILDKRLDGSVEVVGQFTAVEDNIRLSAYILRKTTEIT